MKLRIILILYLIFNLTIGYCQQHSFSKVGLSDGLSQSSVYNIFQDRKGFMWFGTGDGLNRFDGYEIKNYKITSTKNLEGSGNFYDPGAAQSSNSDIYFSGRNGVTLYRYNADKIVRFFPKGDTNTFNNLILVLGIDTNENLYLFGNGFIYKYNLNTLALIAIPLKDPTTKETIYRFGKMDSSGRIWYSLKHGIGSYNTINQEYKYFLIDKFKQTGVHVTRGICEYSKDEMIIASYALVVKLNYKTGQYITIKSDTDEHEYFDAVVDKQKRIWVSSLRNGLICFDKDKIYTYQFNKYNPKSIGSNIASKLYIDKSNNLWVGCDGQGVSKTNLFTERFNLYRNEIEKNIKFNSDFIRCFYEDENDGIYFCTYDEGIHKLDRKNKTVKVFKQPWQNSNIVADILRFDKGNLLIANTGGIFTFNLETEKASQIPIIPKGIQAQLYSILYTKQKNLLLAGFTGFYRGTVVNNTIKEYHPDSTIPLQFIIKIYQTKNGNIWIGTIGGPVYILKENGTGLTLLKSILLGYNIRSFYEDSITNTLWMASEKGLIKYSLLNSSYEVTTTKNGLSNNYLYGILPGRKNELWLSSNNGLIRYNTLTKTCNNFDELDGLQSNEFNTGSYYKSKKGELFFGGINGFNCFFPAEISFNRNVPSIALTHLKIQDEETNEFGNPALLEQIELLHTRNTISFDFSALEFTNSAKNNYQYKLEGVDPSWVNSGKNHFTRYSSLLPGKYIFYVKASNNDGLWSKPKQLIKIIIQAPWWQQWWAKLIFTIVLIGVFAAGIRYFSFIKLKNRLQLLEKQHAVSEERSRISKDMHDDLGSGLSKIAILSELLKTKVREDTELTKQVDKISIAAGELVDNMGQIVWTMNSNNDTIENLLSYIREYAIEFFEDTNVICKINFEEAQDNIIINQQLRRNIFLVIKETLNNTLKHAQAEEVKIKFSLQNNKFQIVINDNGKGFDISNTRRFGNGLINMHKRMETVGGNYQITSTTQNGTKTTLSW
jgi:signal transduction histidine kinase/ligand-binding sensor domain-containing protein